LRLFLLIFLGSLLASREAFAVYGQIVDSSRYRLRGEIQLTYDKRWSTDSDERDFERFTHTYNLGISGFIIDKRLITFELDGSFSQELNKPGNDIISRGVTARVRFFNEKVLRGFFRKFPQPIELRFSNYRSSGTSLLSYGISLTYRPSEKPLYHARIVQQQQEINQRRKQQIGSNENRKQKEQKNLDEEEDETEQGQGIQAPERVQIREKKELGVAGPVLYIPFPTFYLDYDKYRYKTFGQDLNTDRLDIRAESLSPRADFTAEYSYYRLSGSSKGTYQDLDLRANFRSYDDLLARRLDIYNRIFLRDYNDVKSIMLSNTTLWSRWLGKDRKDLLSFTGNAQVFKDEEFLNYNIGGTGTYNKYFSESLRDTISSSLNYGRNNDETLYSINASNVIYYNASRNFLITNNLSTGYSDLGANFRGGIGLTFRTVVDIMTSYDFSSSATDEGRADSHYMTFGLSGRISRNLNFNSRNSYSITTVRGEEPYRQKSLEIRGDIYWRIWRLYVNLGAIHLLVKKENADSTETGSTSLYSNISTYLSRRASLNLSTTYTKIKNGESLFSIHPILSWSFRLVSITAEYEMLRHKDNDKSYTDHRVFMRLIRTFSRNIRGFR